MSGEKQAHKQGALTVEDALSRVLDDVKPISDIETVSLFEAEGRVLAKPVVAHLTQPPFTASAMDGYAVRGADVAVLPASLRVIGESAAGHAFSTPIGAGEAVRIFTGAPLPPGADAIVIQEDTVRDSDLVRVVSGSPDGEHVRPKGGDFTADQVVLEAGREADARAVTLAAAAGNATLVVRRRPIVALLATGDELVMPGEMPRADQIVCSNPFGIAAMVRQAGGVPTFLGIARDTREDLRAHLETARGADVIVTIGGASVGDHDLVGPVLADMGLSLAFWKIAMRPGKPFMYGRKGKLHVMGLPGNPVSALVTARLFLKPLIDAMLGLPPETVPPHGILTAPLAANDDRQDYIRATLAIDSHGRRSVSPFPVQDSSMQRTMQQAQCLIIRPPLAPAAQPGQSVPILLIDF